MALFGRETAQDRQREQAWRVWFHRQHPFALASLVLSVFSLTHFGTLFVDEIAVFVLVSFIRWFEQTAEAVDNRWWNKVTVLLMMPFAVWFFPSKISAGRATPVPKHEPVRGFGKVPKAPAVVEDVPAEAGATVAG